MRARQLPPLEALRPPRSATHQAEGLRERVQCGQRLACQARRLWLITRTSVARTHAAPQQQPRAVGRCSCHDQNKHAPKCTQRSAPRRLWPTATARWQCATDRWRAGRRALAARARTPYKTACMRAMRTQAAVTLATGAARARGSVTEANTLVDTSSAATLRGGTQVVRDMMPADAWHDEQACER